MADIGGFKEEKKELIKENLKIKNQLQLVNSEYENIKRIYNSLLEEYLDLQFAENFDKVLVFQDEVSELRNNNFKLTEELRVLKDELGVLKLREKESSYTQINSLNEENERLKEELSEKESGINSLNLEIENLKAQQFSIEKLVEEGNKEKESLIEKNAELLKQIEELRADFNENQNNILKIKELNEYVEEFQTELDKVEKDKEESIKREQEITKQLKETQEELNVLGVETKNSIAVLEIQLQEKENSCIELQLKINDLIDVNESFSGREFSLNNKIDELDNRLNEQSDYVKAMELELETYSENLIKSKQEEDVLHTRIFDLEKELENREKQSAFEGQREEFVSLNEKIQSLEEKVQSDKEYIEKILLEKEELQTEITYKNSELEQTRFINEDSLLKIANFETDFLKLKEMIEQGDSGSRDEEIKHLEENLAKVMHKNYNFRLMTSRMFAKFIEEKNVFERKIKFLEKELKLAKVEKELKQEIPLVVESTKIPTANSDEQSIFNVLDDFLIENEEEFTREPFVATPENKTGRVDIKGVFGQISKEDKGHDILGAMISDLEKRKEYHIYQSQDVENQSIEKDEIIEEQENLLEDSGIIEENIDFSKDLKTIYSFENKEEIVEEDNINDFILEEENDSLEINEVKFDFINEEKNQEINEITKEEVIEEQQAKLENVNIATNFVKINDLFEKDKLEEFVDFLKFMLPRTIEADIPLLEKDLLYFMVSFAFYYHNGDDFWQLLLDKLEIADSDRPRYKAYLRKELDTIFKMHNFYQFKDETGERIGTSIIMHSVFPAKQLNEYLSSLKDIYTFDLKGDLDKNIFNKLLLRKMQEESNFKEIKSLKYLEETGNINVFLDYSYDILLAMDSKARGQEVEILTNTLISDKISNLFEKNNAKKSRFGFDGFYGFGKK